MIELHVLAGTPAAASLDFIKGEALRHPGEHELVIVAATRVCDGCGLIDRAHPSAGCSGFRPRAGRVTLGPQWRYDASPACLAHLAEFGTVRLPDSR